MKESPKEVGRQLLAPFFLFMHANKDARPLPFCVKQEREAQSSWAFGLDLRPGA